MTSSTMVFSSVLRLSDESFGSWMSRSGLIPYCLYARAKSSRFCRAILSSFWSALSDWSSSVFGMLGLSAMDFLIISSATTFSRGTAICGPCVIGVAEMRSSNFGLIFCKTISLLRAKRPPNICSSSMTTTIGICFSYWVTPVKR